MVREAVGLTLEVAKRNRGRTPKEVPGQSDEAIAARKERQLKGIPGHAHGESYDYSEPLGDANLYKSQGAANFGNYTGVGPNRMLTAEQVLRQMREMQLRRIIRAVVAEEVKVRFGGR